MPTRTLELIKCIDTGKSPDGNIDELIELAKLNKVLLGFLRRIGYHGQLRNVEEERYKRYMTSVAEVAKALEDLDYAFYKFRKPVEHVSVDIDILIRREHISKAARRLAHLGYRVEVVEPYTLTMTRGESIVDLYTQPSFAWVIYLDGERLLEEAEEIELDYTTVRALTREAESIAVAAHAVYKEHIYLLSDYYVTKKWLNKKALKLAQELHAEEAIQISLEINKQIKEGWVEAPTKINQAQTIITLTRKFVRDSNFRSTSMNSIKLVTKRRTINQLIQRLKRKSY